MKTKEKKRKEALIRQKIYDDLSPEKKLEKLNKSNHRARKQRRKISKLMSNDQL